MKSSPWRRVCTAALLTSLAFFTAACGSDDTNTYSGFNQGQANRFLGNFAGRGALSSGQTGTLNLSVGANGQATGTFVVTNPAVQALANFSVATGSYSISGTVDQNTGAFTLTGTVPDFGTFTITGVLTQSGTVGSYAITLNGQTFTGSIQPGTTPPSNTNPTGNGTTKPIASGSLTGFSFTGSGFNGVNPPLTSPIVSGELTTGTTDNNHLTIALAQTGSSITNFRTLSFVVITHGSALTTGTYNILQNSSDNGFSVSLSDTTGTTINSAWAQTSGTTGTFTITSLTDSRVEADFNVSNVGPNSVTPGSAVGTFNASGHVVGNFLSLP
ncbi:MAG: hypothetical protein J0I12_24690 [Candidatus Eremiobacteraeota bacterium]|nr:hypothetical protein [Candidatus Eremiobacteraeota bacterium]